MVKEHTNYLTAVGCLAGAEVKWQVSARLTFSRKPLADKVHRDSAVGVTQDFLRRLDVHFLLAKHRGEVIAKGVPAGLFRDFAPTWPCCDRAILSEDMEGRTKPAHLVLRGYQTPHNNCLNAYDRLRPFHRIPMALRYEFFLES